MCQQPKQMYKLTKNIAVTTAPTATKLESPSSSSSSSSLHGKQIVNFVGCGVDSSCPESVTTALNSTVELDHYQIGSIQQRALLRSNQRSSSGSSSSSSNLSDHDFEWYDLDAIRSSGIDPTSFGCNSTNPISNSCSTRLDVRAGLVFTTERQVLRQAAQANSLVDPWVVRKNKMDTNSSSSSTLDSLLVWASNSIHGNHPTETLGDREFREQMKELEQEILPNCSNYSNGGRDDSVSSSTSFLYSSFSSLSFSSL